MPQGPIRSGVYTPTTLDRMMADEVERCGLGLVVLYPPNTPKGQIFCFVRCGLKEDLARREVRH